MTTGSIITPELPSNGWQESLTALWSTSSCQTDPGTQAMVHISTSPCLALTPPLVVPDTQPTAMKALNLQARFGPEFWSSSLCQAARLRPLPSMRLLPLQGEYTLPMTTHITKKQHLLREICTRGNMHIACRRASG